MNAQHFGAKYYASGVTATEHQREGDLYAYSCYIGSHTVNVASGDSAVILRDGMAEWVGQGEHVSNAFAAVIRGYNPGYKSASLNMHTNLPYVNGCSTKQIFPPERLGDPKVLQLTIPPYTSEQAHHIHSTVRLVYVLKGRGYSIVGQSDKCYEEELKPGMVCTLSPMTPHHFRTEEEWLTVIPFHVWSSIGALENSHPMFNGTYKV